MNSSQPSSQFPLTNDEEAILRLTYERIHPTIAELHQALFPTQQRRRVLALIQGLTTRKLLALQLLHPEQGAASVRYLRLTHRGAHAIGVTKLSGVHYRPETEANHARRALQGDLAALAARPGWRIASSEQEARLLLTTFLAEIAQSSAPEGAMLPHHILSSMIPAHIGPDLVIDTPQEALICVMAHPHAGRAFWRARLARYRPILDAVRLVALCLTAGHERDLRDVLARSDAQLRGRILVLGAREFETLPTLLG